MKGRRSVWSDPRVIKLSQEFVAATDEVWRLQDGEDPECRLFRRMSEEGHYRQQLNHTRQGYYICTPSGQLIDSLNSQDPTFVIAFMQRSLKKWDDLSEAEQKRPPADFRPSHRWEDSYPEDGLILTMFVRDLPRMGGPLQPRATHWNQDHIWFSADEARQWLPAVLDNPARFALPRLVVERLARFHFVDAVKGQTPDYRSHEVADSQLDGQVVDRNGGRARLRYCGRLLARSGSPLVPRGMIVDVLGKAIYDEAQGRFVQFDLVAIGDRWGRTEYNSRAGDGDSNPVGFVARLAAPNAPRVAPSFAAWGYADWIRKPE